MGRKTNYIVFVDKSELDDPDALFDAVISHLIKKGCDMMQRKRFLAQFIKAFTHDEKMRVVGEWVQVRDAATYPFRNKSKAEIAAETENLLERARDEGTLGEEAASTTEEVSEVLAEVIDVAKPTAKKMVGALTPEKEREMSEAGLRGAAAGRKLRKEVDEDKGVEGGVSLDDGADGEPESGVASD